MDLDYSIVIPAHNEEAYLPATLASVRRAMSQVATHRGEIVVTDNDSTDRTSEVATDGGARVVFEEHRQIARARNVGGHFARGRYLIFLDADTSINVALLRSTLDALDGGEVCGDSSPGPAAVLRRGDRAPCPGTHRCPGSSGRPKQNGRRRHDRAGPV